MGDYISKSIQIGDLVWALKLCQPVKAKIYIDYLRSTFFFFGFFGGSVVTNSAHKLTQ